MFEAENELLARIKPGADAVRSSAHGDPDARTDHLTLQWHITDRCNLKCSHCYIHGEGLPELALSALESLLDNYIRTLGQMNARGRIHLTGGEPFVRKDFFELLELIRARKEYCSFAVLCNGTMINDENASRLKELGCAFVQVSVDGGKDVHDSIRGEGSFMKALAGIRTLRRHGIPVSVSFTAGRSVLTLLADGRIVPCRRMPVITGDLKTQSLYDIYHGSALLRLLRNSMNVPAGCEDCSYRQACNGGLKCLSYAVHGNPFVRDPHCSDLILDKMIHDKITRT